MNQLTLEDVSLIITNKEVEILNLTRENVALKNKIAELESTINKQNDEKGEDENAKINKK